MYYVHMLLCAGTHTVMQIVYCTTLEGPIYMGVGCDDCFWWLWKLEVKDDITSA